MAMLTTGIAPPARTLVVAGASFARWQLGFLQFGALGGGLSLSVPTAEVLPAQHYAASSLPLGMWRLATCFPGSQEKISSWMSSGRSAIVGEGVRSCAASRVAVLDRGRRWRTAIRSGRRLFPRRLLAPLMCWLLPPPR